VTTEHRVAGHLGVIAEDYDRVIRTFIPNYDRMVSTEDHYFSLPDELALIAEAGFARPDCFWRDGGLAVYGGFETG
jgi:hypothetical protein